MFGRDESPTQNTNEAEETVVGLPASKRSVGPYAILSELGSGGMGAVYAARHTTSGQQVAIKFLHSELARDPEMSRRFRREASILKSLDHPGVVQVVEVGEDDSGRAYTVMELLQGETLEARLERGPLAPAEFSVILNHVATALDAVHAHGVLHGDLKPANVFLLEEGTKLVDFGTSKVHGLERLTRTGEVSGTPIYMAPELLTGEGGIDERIDTYALGVLAYKALTGAVPFTERNPGRLLYQIVMGATVRFEERCPTAPHAVAAAVHQAMSAKRDERFAKASAFAHALAASC